MRILISVLQVLLAGAIVTKGLLVAHHRIGHLSQAGSRHPQELELQRYACVERALRAAIPPGALVHDEGVDALDHQRIAELLTPGYRFTSRPVPGAYRVTFQHPGPCLDTAVVVTRVVG